MLSVINFVKSKDLVSNVNKNDLRLKIYDIRLQKLLTQKSTFN